MFVWSFLGAKVFVVFFVVFVGFHEGIIDGLKGKLLLIAGVTIPRQIDEASG